MVGTEPRAQASGYFAGMLSRSLTVAALYATFNGGQVLLKEM